MIHVKLEIFLMQPEANSGHMTHILRDVTDIMPSGMLSIGKLLPSYHAADLGWLIANGQTPTLTNALVLMVWTLIFVLAAALLAPRAARIR